MRPGKKKGCRSPLLKRVQPTGGGKRPQPYDRRVLTGPEPMGHHMHAGGWRKVNLEHLQYVREQVREVYELAGHTHGSGRAARKILRAKGLPLHMPLGVLHSQRPMGNQ